MTATYLGRAVSPANTDLDLLAQVGLNAAAAAAAAQASANAALAKFATTDYGLSVYNYGVVGDGVADDTAALQAALTAGAAQGRLVYGLAAKCKISSALTMAGPGLVFDLASFGLAGDAGIYVTGSGYTALTVTNSPQQVCLAVYGTGNTANGVYFNNPVLARVQYLRVYNLNGFGVKVDECFDCLFEKVSVQLCGNTAQYAFSVNDGAGTSNMSRVLQLQVENATAKAIYVSANTLSSVFDNIHSEQAIGNVLYDTWFLGGGNCQYNSGRFDASGGTSTNATLHLRAQDSLFENFRVEGGILTTVEAFSSGNLTLVAPNMGIFTLTTNQTGCITVFGGHILSMNSSFARNSGANYPQAAFLAYGTRFGTLTIADCQNPPVPELCQLHDCTIEVISASSSATVSAITLVNCDVKEGNNLCASTVLINSRVACASACTRTDSAVPLVMVRSVLTGALTFTGNSPVRMYDSQITGTVSKGDAGAHDFICDGMSTVGSASSSITSEPSGNAHLRGETHWNPLPTSGATPGWRCTTAGTPGTWKAMANLA